MGAEAHWEAVVLEEPGDLEAAAARVPAGGIQTSRSSAHTSRQFNGHKFNILS